MKQVLVLQHAACETPGLIAQAIEAAGGVLKTVRTPEGEDPPIEIQDAAGLVIMGGPMGVYEANACPFLSKELALIQSALSARRPVLGVCLGSQLLAAALGAPVKKGKRKEIGFHSVMLSDAAHQDLLWNGIESSFTACHWHGDVFDLPAGATALASSEITPYQAFRHGDSAYGFLFHMEMTPEILRCMTLAFRSELEEEGLSGEVILRQSAEYLPKLAATGSRVFQRWAGLLQDYQ